MADRKEKGIAATFWLATLLVSKSPQPEKTSDDNGTKKCIYENHKKIFSHALRTRIGRDKFRAQHSIKNSSGINRPAIFTNFGGKESEWACATEGVVKVWVPEFRRFGWHRARKIEQVESPVFPLVPFNVTYNARYCIRSVNTRTHTREESEWVWNPYQGRAKLFSFVLRGGPSSWGDIPSPPSACWKLVQRP